MDEIFSPYLSHAVPSPRALLENPVHGPAKVLGSHHLRPDELLEVPSVVRPTYVDRDQSVNFVGGRCLGEILAGG